MFTLVKDWKNKVVVSMGSISKGDEMMKFDVVDWESSISGNTRC